MRFAPVLLLAPILAACAATPPAPALDAVGAAQLSSLLAGRVAGKPTRCLPFPANSSRIINANTVAYQVGTQLYVNRMRGNCISDPSLTLVTRVTGSAPCSGDVAHLVHSSSNVPAGSCVLGDFVPYALIRP